ncbi:unnamed protein product [Notodromas monacha]|uniref:Uncharacterized protein n=1 Tax=Notodromas monacha TaxID=399045 RepID=A0A7R9BX60_9CRUS|nr:unnamed protein product [Notodromas monacha]CAG0921742.1 unnamed protein product [Notodromas monacha]
MELFNIDTRELMESQSAEKILGVYTEGKALILIITKRSEPGQDKKDPGSVKKAWTSFLGPESTSEAKEMAPESFRGIFLDEDFDEGIWCDMSQDVQVRMMRQHFPDFVDNLVSGTGTVQLKDLDHCLDVLNQAKQPTHLMNRPSFDDEQGQNMNDGDSGTEPTLPDRTPAKHSIEVIVLERTKTETLE